MKFLKFSIFLLFMLSTLTAGVSFYLSTLRENEKEKRMKVEAAMEVLQGEAIRLEERVDELELQNEEMQQRHEKDLSLKDLEIDAFRDEAREFQRAFESTQKRNRELERVLDELEAKIRSMTSSGDPARPQVGFVQMQMRQPPEGREDATSFETPSLMQEPAVLEETSVAVAPQPEASAQEVTQFDTFSEVKPKTVIPSPTRRKRGFPFFQRISKGERAEELVEEAAATVQEQPSVVWQPAPPKEVIDETPEPEPEPVKTFELVAPAPVVTPQEPEEVAPPRPRSDQSIAAGRVLLVNRKYNFMVSNLGARQKIALEDTLIVERNGRQIAKTRVEKLYDDYCAAYIIEEQAEFPIEEGDLVSAV